MITEVTISILIILNMITIFMILLSQLTSHSNFEKFSIFDVSRSNTSFPQFNSTEHLSIYKPYEVIPGSAQGTIYGYNGHSG
jgi:hypothetical protein